MGHLLGYARVSTTDQHPHLQVDALERAGCYRVETGPLEGSDAFPEVESRLVPPVGRTPTHL